MTALALSPDAIAAAVVALLTGVGTIRTVTNRTPPTPYQGTTPLLMVTPVQNVRGIIASATTQQDRGTLELAYMTVTAAQQNRTQAVIEDDLHADRTAIITALVANNKLGGAVTYIGAPFEEQYNPDGYQLQWQGAEWVGFALRVSYQGPKLTS